MTTMELTTSSDLPSEIPGRWIDVLDTLIRDQAALDRWLRDPAMIAPATRTLLAVGIVGLVIHGVVLGVVSVALGITDSWAIGWMPLTFAAAFAGALSICLPSFYFYTQLSGLDASFRLVTAQALRAQATTSVFLLGVLPFYAALALAAALGVMFEPAAVIATGALLPFLVGTAGLKAVYDGFGRLAVFLERTHPRRGGVLQRMVLCWGAVYSAIAPIALWRMSEVFGFDLAALTSSLFGG